jgi:hypothetical protein
MMSTDIVAAYYGGDTAVMIVEGAYQLANDVKK